MNRLFISLLVGGGYPQNTLDAKKIHEWNMKMMISKNETWF